ncbi:SDR family NAD(P)-dependent oxidoreductase [Salipaludibacillus aurantiacus]|uniref:Short-chain dehydrogenase n=1 Tax=Salipaludibacillus aurantiacus TaxID=1601833 RepID=A0A1H9Q9B5_9BACI|nr:SDR family oxidoreductase [Salipaludibacillus aurantiacus]SER57030.1 Short-chain dehydrogenase [Salipaludibacillus aurantiacus]
MEKNQVVVITGASKGLGRALTLAFAKKGAKLAICARGETQLESVKKEAEALGADVLAVQADISKAQDVDRFISLTELTYGHADVLINNASTVGPSPIPHLADTTEKDFLHVVQTNTIGVFLITKRVLAGMLQRGTGSIINVTSEAGNTGYAGWGVYGISKFALEGMSETWADELSGTDIRINMIDPGEMDTVMHALAVPDCDYDLWKPEKVVDVFLYLASDKSKGVNGKRLRAQEFTPASEEAVE